MKISITIPAHNEEKRIGKTLEEYSVYFENLRLEKGLDYEIIVVINNTNDKTEEVVKKFCVRNKRIKYLNFKQGGKGFAIIEGFKEALKSESELVGFVDADMATSPEAFYELIKNIGNYDGIIASRREKEAVMKGKSLARKITSQGFNFIVRALFFFPYKDTQCGAKLFTQRAIKKVYLKSGVTQWAFDIDILYHLKKEGFNIKEIPTIWNDKKGSNINVVRNSIEMFFAVLRLRLIYSPFERIARMLRPLLRIIDKILRKQK